MQALTSDPTARTSSAILEMTRPPRRKKRGVSDRVRLVSHYLVKHRWDLAYLPVPAIPIFTLFILLYARYWALAHPREFLIERPGFFYALLVSNALMGFGMSVWAYFLFTERRELAEEMRVHRRREEERGEALVRLEKEMELLTAMRDLSRIINDDVQFEAVWTRVLEVLGSIVKCRRITIFMLDDQRLPVARILHYRGKTTFRNIDADELDMTNVYETLQHRSILRLAEGTQCFWTYPLMADGELGGVLQIVASLKGDAEDKVRRIERHEETIRHLLKHISLALKTPTLYDRAVMDGLTGMFNKQHFISELRQAYRLVSRTHSPFTLVMSDIDFFKSVNDNHGHLIGDRCLQVVAQVLKEQVRTCDMVFRYGGEEMCLLLANTREDEAIILAERINEAIAAAEVPLPDGSSLSVTASMGLCMYREGIPDPEELISRADQALYMAKNEGRNQIWYWTDDDTIERTPGSPTARLKKPKNAR